MEGLRDVLKRLRIAANLSQSALGQELGVSRDLIARIENNLQNITFEIVNKYSAHFKVSLESINLLAQRSEQPFLYLLRAHHGEYFTPELRNDFESWYDRMEISTIRAPLVPILKIPDNLPGEYKDSEVKAAGEKTARQLRKEWDMGTAPIPDPVNLVESLGYFITGEDLGENHLFAVTGKRGPKGKPAMMINTNPSIPIERQRFSVFHELAHIIAHDEFFEIDPDYSGYGKGKDKREVFADSFAGNIQAPNDEIERAIRIIRLEHAEDQILFILKKYFKVSYQTILYRLRDTGYLNYDKFREIFNEMKNRFGNSEPLALKESLKFNQNSIINEWIEKREVKLDPGDPN